MANLERVIKGTPEQLETILINGSITVNDITITREEIEAGTTLFDTGRLDQMALNQQVKTDMHRLYGYNHTSFAVKDINTVYDEIIEENSELASASAVGFSAVMKIGETIPKQGNRLFINGSEEQNSYTFSGDGCEYVNVWHFANNGTLDLSTAVELDIIDFKTDLHSDLTNTLTIDPTYYKWAKYIDLSRFDLGTTVYGAKKVVTHEAVTGTTKIIGLSVEEFVDYGITSFERSSNFNPYSNIANLKRVCYPNVTTYVANSSYDSCFKNAPNLELELPSLISTSSGKVFTSNIKKFTFPETTKTINAGVDSVNTLIMNCRDAESISTGWCNGTIMNFSMCDNWGATINIVTAASRWGSSDFIDLLVNKLRDFSITENQTDNTPDSNGFYRKLTIPSAMLAELEADTSENGGAAALATAEAKLWDIVGG